MTVMFLNPEYDEIHGPDCMNSFRVSIFLNPCFFTMPALNHSGRNGYSRYRIPKSAVQPYCSSRVGLGSNVWYSDS